MLHISYISIVYRLICLKKFLIIDNDAF